MAKSKAKSTGKRKDPAAVALGRKGGTARMRNMTPEERSEFSRRNSLKRWTRREAPPPAS